MALFFQYVRSTYCLTAFPRVALLLTRPFLITFPLRDIPLNPHVPLVPFGAPLVHVHRSSLSHCFFFFLFLHNLAEVEPAISPAMRVEYTCMVEGFRSKISAKHTQPHFNLKKVKVPLVWQGARGSSGPQNSTNKSHVPSHQLTSRHFSWILQLEKTGSINNQIGHWVNWRGGSKN